MWFSTTFWKWTNQNTVQWCEKLKAQKCSFSNTILNFDRIGQNYIHWIHVPINFAMSKIFFDDYGHRLRTPKMSFFSNMYQIGRISFEVFYGILGSAIPSPWFLQKARILQDFPFGIGLWIWAVENLRSSHHASVVRDYGQSLKQSLKSILHTIAWLLCAPSVGCNAHHMAFDPLEFGHWKIWAPPPPKSTSEPAVAIDPIFGVHLHFWARYGGGSAQIFQSQIPRGQKPCDEHCAPH